ncbi:MULTISPECIES: twin-arginine translocase TatA/TatE family subunit [Sphingomonadaceae]|uniref:twin-arginine translocase TatA/TatE family subunit n=1 Tax=Sphingomonadaceae TaxID=41297 RepID=UPI00115828AE|nr:MULTISPECIES: twin-arginine translocase TatA/TatE family subunit [Sphingomonadaceae]QDK33694.1 twin-arginine translocase TatA/TatE family subunit [Sphingomonas sp. IC081]QSR17606.1 twin-arginine translocase TatA/TatE family subunit [Novosphingobium sp. KA1]
MGSFSIWHWMIVLVIVLVLFGRGRVSEIMGDFGKGIKSFKEGMNEDEAKKAATPPAPAPQITAGQDAPAATTTTENKSEQA